MGAGPDDPLRQPQPADARDFLAQKDGIVGPDLDPLQRHIGCGHCIHLQPLLFQPIQKLLAGRGVLVRYENPFLGQGERACFTAYRIGIPGWDSPPLHLLLSLQRMTVVLSGGGKSHWTHKILCMKSVEGHEEHILLLCLIGSTRRNLEDVRG